MTRVLIASLLVVIAACAHGADEFREGEHYQLVAKPLSVKSPDKIEVVELFWYGCPHCFHFEPLLKAWLKTKPGDVEFRRIPALFAENWVPHARAFFAAEALGALEEFHSPLFRAIHEDDKKIMDEESLIAFAASVGVSSSSFSEAYAGFAIDGKVKQAMAYTRDSGITGVPSVIVNGKYRTGAQMAGGQDKVMDVVDFLIEKERAK
ncbi:MAG: thiol:disulfide interchange protein DsbA/DsbL [Gammaproteobacteria bacterium]|nr:thiol:disulfide interchange protein DsbA/DsbL [Gammaproteobacteria bacterium]